MSDLDAKINEHFAGFVVRKDLVKAVKGNAIVPTYVLEYLLGQYCATDDEASIQSTIDFLRGDLRVFAAVSSNDATTNCFPFEFRVKEFAKISVYGFF